MARIGLEVPRSGYARSVDEARADPAELDGSASRSILRPSFTLGGTGGGIAYNADEFDEMVGWALAQSPRGQILVEESVLGWKEYELEVMRDRADNVVIICSIENLDPMGVHTGDSITVAPAMTLTDKEYQRMRDAACRVIREIGVETGGSNVQFAVDPEDGRMVVIEMNPRVSRSLGAGVEGDRLPDRQDRREARGRLHARRDPATTSRARRRRRSSRPSTTSSSRCRASPSRSSPAPTRR